MSRYNLYDTCTEFDKNEDNGESSGDNEIKHIVQQGGGNETNKQRETVSCPEDKTIWVHRYDRYNNKPIALTVPEYKTFGNEELITTTVHHIKRPNVEPLADAKNDNSVHNSELVLATYINTYRRYLFGRARAYASSIVNKIRRFIRL